MKRSIAVLFLLILSFNVFATPSCENIRAMGEKYYLRCKEAPELFNFDCLDCNFQNAEDGIVRKHSCNDMKKYFKRCKEDPENFDFDCVDCNFQTGPLSSFYGCKIVPGNFIVCPDGYYHFKGSTVPSEVSDVLRQMKKESRKSSSQKFDQRPSSAAQQ